MVVIHIIYYIIIFIRLIFIRFHILHHIYFLIKTSLIVYFFYEN